MIYEWFPEIMYTTVGRQEVAICNLVEEWFLLLNINIWISIFFCCSLLIMHVVFFFVENYILQWNEQFGNEENIETYPLKISIVYSIYFLIFLFSHTPSLVNFFYIISSKWISAVMCKKGLTLPSFYLVFNKHYGDMT